MSSQQGVIQILDILAQMCLTTHSPQKPKFPNQWPHPHPKLLSNENLSRQGL